MKPDLIRHLSGEPIGRLPVWMMRQAGRYLPRYRAMKEQHSFWEMATTPELASEVSLLPLEVIDVDAVIFFSDIMTLPHGLGLPIELKEKVGPYLEKPLRAGDFDCFDEYDPPKHNAYVGATLSRIREALSPSKALIGFAGAPWTVGCYLIQGQGSRDFGEVKRWLHEDPASLETALRHLSEATVRYLNYQVESGAQVLQLFDTWACELPRPFFESTYLPLLNDCFRKLKATKVPLIYFAKRSHHLWPCFSELEADVLSLDELVSLKTADKQLGGRFSLQGNLDPWLLCHGPEATIRRKTRALVQEAQELSRPAILNLGHGILKTTPVAHAKAFIEEARTPWI